ncbi:mamJ paralog LimJ-like [Bos javanicus]|uniref:mamJ paralog LimJ-like n=1 Tax=Bos javanicus TaxID=9906 RepID=UPI002AA6D700|nr:mamJ paralog LimJ-like [Bos javanicus]
MFTGPCNGSCVGRGRGGGRRGRARRSPRSQPRGRGCPAAAWPRRPARVGWGPCTALVPPARPPPDRGARSGGSLSVPRSSRSPSARPRAEAPRESEEEPAAGSEKGGDPSRASPTPAPTRPLPRREGEPSGLELWWGSVSAPFPTTLARATPPSPGDFQCEAHAGTNLPGVTLRGGDIAQMLQVAENVQMKTVPRFTSPCLSPARALSGTSACAWGGVSTPLGRTAPTWVLGRLGPDAPFPGPTCALERSWAPLALSGEQRNTPGGGAEEKRALESAFVLNGKENAKILGRFPQGCKHGGPGDGISSRFARVKGLDALLFLCT